MNFNFFNKAKHVLFTLMSSYLDPRTPDHVNSVAIGGRVPNTNMHSVAGSNPMWMQAYESEWYKDRETLR